MPDFIENHREQILGCLSGFDRVIFRGSIRQLNTSRFDPQRGLMVASGMEIYCWQNQVKFKDFGRFVQRASERVREQSLKPYRQAGLPVEFIRDTSVEKDRVARDIAAQRKIDSGLVCAISALEPAPTFDYRKSRVIRRIRPCHVLYHYQIHPVFGWMHARIQTWFPFPIQIALNGREWLSRRMRQEGMKYVQEGNCFAWIEDFGQAQKWMKEQLKTGWTEVLDGFVEKLNPIHDELFDPFPGTYYWTCYQSEWATDVVFQDARYLKRLMTVLTPHAIASYRSADVLRYFGRRINQDGSIPARCDGPLPSNLREYREGERVKFWALGNSLKFYSKAYVEQGSVFRVAETTINNPAAFHSYRTTEGGSQLAWRPMRKGIADLNERAQVSQRINERMMNALASVDSSSRLEELMAPLQKAVTWKGRRVRALRPFGEDYRLLQAINQGSFLLHGVRNKDLQALLYESEPASEAEKKRRSAAISRKLRRLRAHKVIQKVPRRHQYQVRPEARTMLVAILTAARTSLNQINALQPAA